MPLWLQGAVEAFFVSGALILVLLVLSELLRAGGGSADGSFANTVSLAGQLWLSVLGVPLQLHVKLSGIDLSGALSLIPLGLTLLVMVPWWFAGRRLARASAHKKFWQAFIAALGVQAIFGLVITQVCVSENAHAVLWQGILIPLIPAALAFLAGAYWQTRSWDFLVGMNAAEWIARTSQNSRWTGSYFWTLAKAAYVALLSLLGLSAAILAIVTVVSWAQVVTIYERLSPGVLGGSVLTVAELGYLPNLVIWAMSYVSGSGFYAGTGALVSPLSNHLGDVPAVPILAVIPQIASPYLLIVALIPLGAGFLGGWWFYRAGENHFDDWLSLKTDIRWLSWLGSSVVAGVIMGFVAMIGAMLLAWVGSGGAGFGRLAQFGADPVLTGWLVGAEVALGGALGLFASPWIEREYLYEVEDDGADPGAKAGNQTHFS